MTNEQEQKLKEIRGRHSQQLPSTTTMSLWHDVDFLLSLVDSQVAGNAENEARILELERRLRIPFGKFPCQLCGGPHNFDTSVPSVVWNQVIRARGLPEYLCTTCILREFVRAGRSFTAELWNEEFNGVPIELIVNGQNAKDAALVQEENNSLRNQISDAANSIVHEAEKVGQLMQSAATSMRSRCIEKVKEIHEARLRDLRALTDNGDIDNEDAEYERAVLFVLSNVVNALQQQEKQQ